MQDGSFGSRTNPKPGGQASDWVNKNAKSGAARNEEYYGKIEDDNRRNHVEFRKKYPQLFPKVSLDRLEAIEENVYTPCTYCKYDPKSGGGGGTKRNGGNSRGGNKKSGGSSRKSGRDGNKGSNVGQRSGGGNSRNSQYQKDIASGKVPGKAGQDYPTFSLKQLEKKGFKGIQPAPADKIVQNYPKKGSRNGGGAKRTGAGAGGARRTGGGGGGGGECPGTMEDCMAACPAQVRVFKVCVASCGRRCAKK